MNCSQCGSYMKAVGPGLFSCPNALTHSHDSIMVLQKITPKHKPVKCDLCGSTAIDHTEAHCQTNRLARGNEQVREGEC